MHFKYIFSSTTPSNLFSGLRQYYEIKYSLSAKECSQEELHELTDIKIAEVENSQIYCIPKKEELDEIFNYIIENAPNYKVLKKTRGTFIDHGHTRFNRDRFKTPKKLRKIIKDIYN